jgi:hypothetical protein
MNYDAWNFAVTARWTNDTRGAPMIQDIAFKVQLLNPYSGLNQNVPQETRFPTILPTDNIGSPHISRKSALGQTNLGAVFKSGDCPMPASKHEDQRKLSRAKEATSYHTFHAKNLFKQDDWQH